MNNKMISIAISLVLASTQAFATPEQNCASNIVTCTQQNQSMGDTDNSSHADSTQSHSSNAGNSGVSNDSGMNNSGAFDNSSQNSSNTTGEINGTITGGNTSSTASGNRLDSTNDNRSSVGNTTTGNNTNNNQSSVGNTSSNSGGNVLGNDSSNTLLGGANTASAAGGAGGHGGTGIGQGGTALSGSLSGVSDSGNSTSTNLQGQTTDTRIGDVGSTSGALSGSSSGASTGDQTSNNVSTSGSSADASGNSTVNIDASDRRSDTHSYRSVALVKPTIQTAAPSFVASSNIVAERSACGPRVEKRSERVTGVLGKLSVDLGADDDLLPAAEPYRYWTSPKGSQHVFGHQTVTYAASNGVASSKSFGLNGNNAGLAGGGIGASSNSAASRTVLRIVVQECELETTVQEVRVLNVQENG